MPPRTPALRRHATGVYFCRWGGRDHYFSKDAAASQGPYLDALQEWHRWRQRRPAAARAGGRVLSVAQVYRLFLDATEPDVDPTTLDYYRKHLSRFVNLWGRAPMARLGAPELQDLKTDLHRLGYAPRTINHDLIAVKRLFRWAEDLSYIAPARLRGVRRIPLPPPQPKALSPAAIREMLTLAQHGRSAPDPDDPRGGTQLPGCRSDLATRATLPGPLRCPQLVPWLELSYLALLRPSETVRLVHGQGRFIEEGIFQLSVSKTSRRSQIPRCVVLSPQALRSLEAARRRPPWSRLDSYSAATARACGPGGPGALRHSAATHLHAAGAARADIDLLLGHMPPRVSLTYAPVAWQPLRQIAARLSLPQ